MNYNEKVLEFKVDVQNIWRLQCKNLYYASLGVIAIRELLQNSVDAITRKVKKGLITKQQGLIKITIEGNDIIFEDNGIGMSKEIIHDKFLILGKSDKDNSSEIGGFGVAKAVILGCCDWFSVETFNNIFTLDDIGVNPIREQPTKINGTRITLKNVVYSDKKYIGEYYTIFKQEIFNILQTSDIPYRVLYNGTPVDLWFKDEVLSYKSIENFGLYKEDYPQVETKVLFKNLLSFQQEGMLYVRLNGLTQYYSYKGKLSCNVIVDFNTELNPTDDNYPFTASRESTKWDYTKMLNAISDKLIQKPNSILSTIKYTEIFFDNPKDFDESNRVVKGIIENKNKLANRTNTLLDYVAENPNNSPFLQDLFSYMSAYDNFNSYKNHDTITLNNPLKYSWLILKHNNSNIKDYQQSQLMNTTILWDSFLRIVAEGYKDLSGTLFYPGVILEDEIFSGCYSKEVDGKEREYILLNPMYIPKSNNIELTLYLLGVAVHELSHFLNCDYESHGDRFIKYHQALYNHSIEKFEKLNKLISKSNLRYTIKEY